jgi:hypothetical protein
MQTAMASVLKAFISYRREDSYIPRRDGGEPDFAFIHALAGALKTAGFDEIFVDTGAITPGENYESKIFRAVSDCDLFIAVVGRKWLEILRERTQLGVRDTLVREIRAGLNLEKEIVPLLVDGATMPGEADLPEQIRAFHFQNGRSVRSSDSADTLISALAASTNKVTRTRRLDSWWLRAYIALAVFAYYLCAIQPNLVGLLEFGPQSWGAMAAIWSGFFIWPIFFLPFALAALCRPILVLIESATNASRLRDKFVYLTPLLFGTVLAGLGIALELQTDETPWSIHPALSNCPGASAPNDVRILSHYDEPQDAVLNQTYADEFWMNEKCWPNVFYYLTVPLYQNAATPSYLERRPIVAHAFTRLLTHQEAPHSKVFLPYVISFSMLMWLLGTGIVMSIFFVMVQIRRPDDDSVLRLPSEVAYLCLTYTFVAVMIWIPFRINTDYFKYLYSCENYGRCPGLALKLYFADGVLATALLICYAFLSVGLIYRYGRFALGMVSALAIALTLLGAFLIYWFRATLAQLTDSSQFSVGISIPILLAMIALGYSFDPSVVRFNDFKKDR